MSAFIVEPQTIINLVNLAGHRDISFWNPELQKRVDLSRKELGQLLVNENYRSVNARYREQDKPYQYKDKLENKQDPVQLLKNLACYEYQTCEFKGFEESFIKRVIEELRSKAINLLPGYDDAKWG